MPRRLPSPCPLLALTLPGVAADRASASDSGRLEGDTVTLTASNSFPAAPVTSDAVDASDRLTPVISLGADQ